MAFAGGLVHDMSEAQNALACLRAQLDAIDRSLVHLLNQRADLVDQAFRLKRARGEALYDAARVEEILSSAEACRGGSLRRDEIRGLMAPMLDFFGLMFQPGALGGRPAVQVPTPLQAWPRPWLVADSPPSIGAGAPPLSITTRLRSAGVAGVRTADPQWSSSGALFRVGKDPRADLREWSPDSPAPSQASPVPLLCRRDVGTPLGAWLRGLHADVAKTAAAGLVLLVPADAVADLTRLLERTAFPVLVDVRGETAPEESIRRWLERGADGALIRLGAEARASCPTDRPRSRP